MMEKSSILKSRRTLWIVTALAIAVGFFVFWYSDIGDTLDNGVMLVEAILKGEFTNYYEYAAVNASSYTVYSANYNVLLYAVFAIWNLPTAIIHMATGMDYMTNIAALLWCKLIVVAAFAGIFITTKKISENLGCGSDSAFAAGYLAVSSLCAFIPAMVAVQYDCIALFFMLLGILFYSKGKTWQFLLMFAVALPLKLFAIFILIPMLLIRYKNVLKILGMTALVMLPSIILELPFRGNKYYEAALGSQNGDAAELLLGANVNIGNLSFNLFVTAYIIICFCCYMRREDDMRSETRFAVYYSFAVFGAFCVLVPIRSYWIVLFTPFLALLVSFKKGNRTLAILADTLAGFGGGLFILANHWIYNINSICRRLVLSGVQFEDGTEAAYGSFQGFLEALGLEDLKYAFFAVFAGAVIFSLWYLYPGKSDDKMSFGGEFWAYLSRPVIIILVSALLIYCNFASQPTIKYGSENYNKASDCDLLEGDSAERVITFDSDAELYELSVYLKGSGITRASRSSLEASLTDAASGDVIWEDSVGLALLENEDHASFKLKNISVKKDMTYKLRIYCVRTELTGSGSLFPYLDNQHEIAVCIR